MRLAAPEVIEEAIRPGGLAAIKTGRIQLILDTLHRERGECSLEHMHALSDEQVDPRPHPTPRPRRRPILTASAPASPSPSPPLPPLTPILTPSPPSPSPSQVKVELRGYKGVGAKTVSCVLMFCLGRHDFPVDTHVWKIAIALGWVPKVGSTYYGATLPSPEPSPSPSLQPSPQTADRDATYDHLNAIVPAEIKYELHVLLVQHGKDHKNGIGLLRQTLSTLEE